MRRAVSFVRLYSVVAFFYLMTVGAKCNDVDRSRCLADRECPTGQGCFALPPGSQRCLPYCDAYASILCQDGTVCGFVPADDAQVGACLPGGETVVGNNCSSTAECVKGAVCVVPTDGGLGECRTACEIGGAVVCLANETCVALDPVAAPTRGYCHGPGV